MAEVRGLPLLSGPPPQIDTGEACRKCNKEFNVVFARSRRCNHCGYSYCHNCTDYQALMPRFGHENGYTTMNVCAFCIEYLTITASGKGQLRSVPLSRLRKYIEVYNIKIHRAVEKDDLIDTILAARTSNGCLALENENYYRKYSVPNRATGSPNRGFFSRSSQSAPPPPPPRPPERQPSYNFPRPDLEPDPPYPQPQPQPQPQRQWREQSQTHSRPPPVPPRDHPPYQQHNFPNFPPPPTMPRPQSAYENPPPPLPRTSRPDHYQGDSFLDNLFHNGPSHSRPSHPHTPPNFHPHSPPPPPRPRPASSQSFNPPPPTSATRPRTTSTAPPPTLDELLQMPENTIAALPVGALKSILFTNHVNAGMILEKSDLVSKVRALLEDERRERQRQRLAEEEEERQNIERQREMLEEHTRAMRERERQERERRSPETVGTGGGDGDGDVLREPGEKAGEGGGVEAAEASATATPSSSPPSSSPPKMERAGICVVCQDDEANIAIVDCGHLAMCRGCSELVMKSSRECPLCRTRIVTEARLLRIFRS